MNWENIDNSFEEEEKTSSSQNRLSNDEMLTEEEDITALQLKKYQNPLNDPDRQTFIAIANRFGELLVQGCSNDILATLLTEDCECFLFNFLNDIQVSYSVRNDQFQGIYQGGRVIERKVRQTHVDLSKNVVCQICECKILREDGSFLDQFTFELLTITNSKIRRYRAAFGSKIAEHGPEDPFGATKKDMMLSKVKELNYALAGQPNLEEVAALLHEKTEYKVCSWDDQRCHTFYKSNFVKGFKSLEKDYIIKCIVPYEIYNEAQYIIGTYVYHLESHGKEFVWLTTSAYSFDQEMNIAQIIQQGEFYPKEEASVPFEAFTKQGVEEKLYDLRKRILAGFDQFYSCNVDFNCHILRFGSPKFPNLGSYQGVPRIEQLREGYAKTVPYIEWSKPIDVFVDLNDPSYDVVIGLACTQALVPRGVGYKYEGKRMNFFSMTQYMFENGKLAKMYQFFGHITEPIPSPYEDPDFEAMNIKARNSS